MLCATYAGDLQLSKTLLFMLCVVYKVLAQVHHHKSMFVEGAAEESGLLQCYDQKP